MLEGPLICIFFHYHFEDVNREVINASSFVSRSIVGRLFLPERW